MGKLNSLHRPANVVVIGATGGIGSAFVDHLIADENVGNILACARSGLGSPGGGQKVHHARLDYGDEQSVAQAAAQAASEFDAVDLVIIATGILHNAEFMPEKALRDIHSDAMAQNYLVNTIGPSLVAKHFLSMMRKGSKTVFAALSARVGSISDNGLGGWYSYRASKAALNMMLKSIAIEQARRNADCVVVGLHPGTVDTALSKPFQGNVPEGNLFNAETSAAKMLEVMDGLNPDQGGKTFAYDGSEIPA